MASTLTYRRPFCERLPKSVVIGGGGRIEFATVWGVSAEVTLVEMLPRIARWRMRR
jgi:pyruvate/2-oxoglutarate dehydrogenase complex dihydrolipoamide dehydrogenase (E3) component